MSATVSLIEIIGTICFALAVIHTFSVGFFQKQAHKYKEGSIGENLFHFLGEVEVVFGLWAAIFLGLYSLVEGFVIYDESHKVFAGALHYLESQNFTEPGFVFVIMCMAATRPIILLAGKLISGASKILPLSSKMAFYVSALIVGPILGSFITEPAAMTVTALVLFKYFYSQEMSSKFKYATIGLLFVNVSIGGTLTHFAAPPVLMVAAKYGWDMNYMFFHFGWKAMVAILISTSTYAFIFRRELAGPLKVNEEVSTDKLAPTWWIYAIHILFLGLTVYTAHHMVFFAGLFLFFIGFAQVTSEYQDKLKLKESLLVGFFLGGLVVLGSIQKWWLQDVLVMLGDLPLYFGTTALTAVTDNAALTYLGSLVELSDSAKYYLVAGAVTGGGLTVIANAPNPAGYGILKEKFDGGLINPLKLFLAALFPTFVAIGCFLLIP